MQTTSFPELRAVRSSRMWTCRDKGSMHENDFFLDYGNAAISRSWSWIMQCSMCWFGLGVGVGGGHTIAWHGRQHSVCSRPTNGGKRGARAPMETRQPSLMRLGLLQFFVNMIAEPARNSTSSNKQKQFTYTARGTSGHLWNLPIYYVTEFILPKTWTNWVEDEGEKQWNLFEFYF
jgi:hypothetical protein